MENINKIKIINLICIDKSSIYVAVDSNSWRVPKKITVEELIDNVTIDPSSLNITILPNKPNFFYDTFNNHDVSYYQLPQNSSELNAVHAVMDDNYLYIWVEKQRKWKRIPLSDW